MSLKPSPLVGAAGSRRPRGAGALRPGVLLLVVLAGACAGPQSALAPAGRDAERLAELWWLMAAGAAVIWVLVIGAAWYAVRVRPERHSERLANLLIVGGGAVLPTIVLGALLVYGLSLMPAVLSIPDESGLRVEVSGEQWWWRVTYHVEGREPVELANEIRLPVGRRTELELVSPDVIHSFWIPSLAGKMDMIPGRVNRIALEPTRTGTFRGACAEYCGGPHALMSLYAVVMEGPEFEAWLARQARTAGSPSAPLARRGEALFLEHGCGACHTIRGTPARGTVGPDLTHVGSRVSLAAGILPNDRAALTRWIARPDTIKPGVHMPAFGMLPAGDVPAMAAYLEGLE